MLIDNKKIKEVLLSGDYLSKEELVKAEDFSKKNKTPIINYLLSQGLINKDLLGQAMAESFNIPYADLNSKEPSHDQVLLIPEDIAKKFRVVLFKKEDERIIITTDNPGQAEIMTSLKKLFPDKKIILAYSVSDDIDSTLINYRKSLETRFSKIIEAEERVAPEIIDEIFADALTFQASDIHFEPQAEEVVVRFRVDSVLQEAGRIPKIVYENILNRIKVQSHMRIDEHYAAQDGAMRYVKGDRTVDARVSIVPTLDGEKVAIRVLAEYIRDFGLSNLGLSAKSEKAIKNAAKKPFGMILVTGPTGSGKSTTLYSVLKFLNDPGVNITTIEDPVEYKIIGVNHIQVNNATNLTFAKGLRSIVRQDPDIILVGEIRDNETAEIAVNAALTGHLLLSTFHANDAATAIPRLLDMEIEPFLLASTLEIIIAQRLVRKICDNCKHSISKSKEDLEKLGVAKHFSDEQVAFYQGKGCEKCGHTGYKGRVAIFEFINITKEMEALILTNPSTQEIWEIARKQGSESLFEDGINKVKSGVTTIEELLRVAAPPEKIKVNDK